MTILNFFLRTLLNFTFVLSLSGCFLTRTDVAEVEQRKAVQQQVSSLQKNTADAQSKYSELNDEIRELTGRLEVLENKLVAVNKDREKSKTKEEQEISELRKKNEALEEEIQKLSKHMNILNQEIMKAGTATTTVSTDKQGKKGDKKVDYYKAAEQLYSKKDWKQAIFQYEKYREQNPKGKNLAAATYKIGVSFQELGMKDDAKVFFEEVIENHPSSPLVKQAKERLKKK